MEAKLYKPYADHTLWVRGCPQHQRLFEMFALKDKWRVGVLGIALACTFACTCKSLISHLQQGVSVPFVYASDHGCQRADGMLQAQDN